LSTAAGVRAPLAHVADQVFLELALELEAQGVGRKVVADMFGLALRSYQKKVQRLEETRQQRDSTLWEVVLEYVQSHPNVSRSELLERFRHDASNIGAVCADLVNGGAIAQHRRSGEIHFVATSEGDQHSDDSRRQATTALVWMSIYHGASSIPLLAQRLGLEEPDIEEAVDGLLRTERVHLDEAGALRARRFTVPLGSSVGWEAAVFDHFRAVAVALGTKVATPEMRKSDLVGGQTAAFHLSDDHPLKQEVLSLLDRTRREVASLWQRVSEYNEAHACDEDARTTVHFYLGQYVETSNGQLPALDPQEKWD